MFQTSKIFGGKTNRLQVSRINT